MIKKFIALACLTASSVMAGLPFSLDPFGRLGTSAYVGATGGSISYSYTNGTYYKIHTFTSSGTLTVTSGGTVDALVVAGGGGSGENGGGGGGAGGLVYTTTNVVMQNYTVTVGAGGLVNQNGNQSAFASIAAIGGGRGGGLNGYGVSGGSGGGGGSAYQNTNNFIGGSGSQGSSGGNGRMGQSSASQIAGGGGGGFNSAGLTPTTAQGGRGGDGTNYVISGANVYYAGGGGGGSGTAVGTAGVGGGGTGGGGLTKPTAGVNGTGGGAGGGGNPWVAGTNGGSGIVIVRYPLSTPSYVFPSEISGLTLWLDSADATTLTTSGINVTEWRDKSATAAIFSPVAPYYPTKDANLINNISPILFYTDNAHQIKLTSSKSTTVQTVFLVARIVVPSTFIMCAFGTPSDFGIRTQNSNEWRFASVDMNDFAYPNGTCFVNGTATPVIPSQYAAHILMMSSPAVRTMTPVVGNYFRTYWDGRQFEGNIAEVIGYSGILSTADRQKVEAYLGAKWGIAVTP